MTITIETCACGAQVSYKKTGECKACYHRRYNARYYERNKETWHRAEPRPRITAAMPTTRPCSYLAAHKRVTYWRGKARTHVCPCGAPAQEWSYRGGSTLEQTGLVPKRKPSGNVSMMTVAWSPHVMDYDAMCIPCHRERDGQVTS